MAGIVIIAINPTKQLGDTRNAQRRADVNTILNAVYQYSIDNNGSLPSTITTAVTAVCQAAPCTSLIDLSVLTASEKYLTAIPHDPLLTATTGTAGYTIVKSANGRITVAAPSAEQSAVISVTR